MPHHSKPELFTFEHYKNLFAFTDTEGFTKGALVIIVAVTSYIYPTKGLQDAAIAAGVLVVFDTITGLMAAAIQKKPRTSKAFSRVIAKTFAYLSVSAVATVVEKTIFTNSQLSISMTVLWLVIATEGLSILENVEAISGGKFSVLKKLLGKVIDNAEAPTENAAENVAEVAPGPEEPRP